MATRGWDSRLQASLRITQLMTRSIGPTGTVSPPRAGGAAGAGAAVVLGGAAAGSADSTEPVDPAELTDTCVTWAIPP